MTLDSTIEHIPRISKPHCAALKKLGIFSVRDLLFHFPYRYLDFSRVAEVRDLVPGESISLKVTVRSISGRAARFGRMSLAEAAVSDSTGSLKVVWFNQGYLAKALHPGEELFLSGTPEYYRGSLQLTNPVYERVSDFPIHTARLVPVYHVTEGLYPKTLRSLIAQVLHLADSAEEILPLRILSSQKLLPISDTVRLSHFPENQQQIDAARQRLAFEEIFITQLLAQKHKQDLQKKKTYRVRFQKPLISGFLDALPFTLTPGQKKALWEILQDIEKPTAMNRLVEGDVGSGKTVVALAAALETAEQDLQAAFLAPTEILARQHYESMAKYLNRQGQANTAHYGLLTAHYSELDGAHISKVKFQKLLAEGMPGIFAGTHALLADKTNFRRLALVIIDEQHRFGVRQRAALFDSQGPVPHLLSLTATPIPRTLQLAYFGELEISRIVSKPEGRKKILTRLVEPRDRTRAYEFIAAQIAEGRQVFVVTPLIEEQEAAESKAAKTEFQNLQKIFPKLSIALLHGKMKSAEKERVMKEFLDLKTHILVATSVVEVGVDVPNASVMVIEGAEAFGLAQLHQFRGRVGRAEHQSYCLLFTEKEDPKIRQRLEDFAKTHDGFALAELDLKQRGFGELYGAKQSGWNFKYFNPSYISLIPPARKEALALLKEDPGLSSYPLILSHLSGKTVHFE